MSFYSTKKMGPISTGHRQWRDDGHCAQIHGYGRYVEFTFECLSLDGRQWVMDFGDLKDVKKWLEEQWDHRVLIASDDPQMELIMQAHSTNLMNVNIMDVSNGYGPGIEGSCKFVYDHVNPMILKKTGGRVWVKRVQIWEHENNTAIYEPTNSYGDRYGF